MIEFFGSLIVGFEGVVFYWPRRRNSIWVIYFIEVTLAEAQQDAAVDLAIATDKIMKSGMKFLSLRVILGVRRLITRIRKDGLAVPIFPLPRQIIAALQEEDALSCLCQPPGHGAPAWARANDDHIIMLAARHGFAFRFDQDYLGCPSMHDGIAGAPQR